MSDMTSYRTRSVPSLGTWVSLFVVCSVILAIDALPNFWSGNALNYFDLAFRTVQPDAPGIHYSVVDSSNARFLSFWIIGSLIEILGFEGANIASTLFLWLLQSAGIAFLTMSLRMGVVEVAVAVSVLVLTRQSLLGAEWIFGTVEPKTFAYISVFFGIGLAFFDRWFAALALAALATYFHFLVGGFWGLALLLLYLLRNRSVAGTARLFGIFTLMILPMFLLLVWERIGVETDVAGLPLTVNEIYAVFRAPHHIAPFNDPTVFLTDWAPGLIIHIGLFAALSAIRKQDDGGVPGLALWVGLLNLYIPFAMLLAFFDRGTHHVAMLYLFRPSGLILLLSLLVLASFLARAIADEFRQTASVVALSLMACIALPASLLSMATFTAGWQSVADTMNDDDRALVDWIRNNTPDSASILMEPPGDGGLVEGALPFGAFERLTRRGFIVNYKFIPTAKPDMVRWYRLLDARAKLLDGDCGQIRFLEADYLVAQSVKAAETLGNCGDPVFSTGTYSVFRVPAQGAINTES